MRVIGLMSGTSADGVDAALVEWPRRRCARARSGCSPTARIRSRPTLQRAHPRARGRARARRGEALRELAALDVALGERFAEAARAVARDAGVALAEVDAIASHGQTVAHHPELRATLQIGDPVA